MRNQARNVPHNEPENDLTELQHFHQPTSGLNTCSAGHFRDNARIKLGQNNDVVLRNLRSKIKGNPFGENDLAFDYRYQHYHQNITKIKTKREVLTRRDYSEKETTSHYQMLLPTQHPEKLLRAF